MAVIGEPGSGKTHLMMRLAKELLKVNRLLFIPSPNNPESVLYHIYCHVLDSFIRKVSNSDYSQLEFLLAHSLVKLMSSIGFMAVTQMDKDIANWVKNNPLNLFEQLRQKDFESQKAYWEKIEKNVDGWWMITDNNLLEYAPKILKGIIKFCRYGDNNDKKIIIRWLAAEELDEAELNRLGLDNWKEEMSKEDFSLQAISVFSKLSLLDEPLIIVFDQLESLGLEQNKKILLSFGEATKEIFTHVPNSLIILNLFPERWEDFKLKLDDAFIDRVSQYKLVLSRPSDQNLQEILSIKAQSVGLDLSKLFTQQEIELILAHSSIRKILNSAEEYYLSKNPRSEPIKVTKDCITNIEKEFQVLKRLFQNKELQTLGTSLKKMDQDLLELQEKLKDIVNDPDPTELIRLFLAQSRLLLEKQYEESQIITDSGDVGKLKVILQALQQLKNFTLDCLLLGRRKIPEHLVIKKNDHSSVIAFLNADGTAFTARLKNFNDLVSKNKQTKFRLLRNSRQPNISSREEIEKLNNTVRQEIKKLNNSSNGQFCLMNKEDRISFELIHKVINDINNRDLDVSLETAWPVIDQELSDCWLLKVLNHF